MIHPIHRRLLREGGVTPVLLMVLSLLLASCGGTGNSTGETAPSSTPSLAVEPTKGLEVTETAGSAESADQPEPGGPAEVNLGSGSALVWGEGKYGVVLVHGAIYDAASWTDQAEAIAAEGFAVVAVEHATADDTHAAIDYLRRSTGIEAVALIGASAGTSPVLNVASERTPEMEPPVDLVIVLAGSGNVDSLNVPSVMFISAEGDGAASSARRMMEATSGDPADLVIVPGSAHAQALFNQPEGVQVLNAIVERLASRKALLNSGTLGPDQTSGK